jgi:hypothetical protein
MRRGHLLDPQSPFSLYQVDVCDGQAFEDVISGQSIFVVREIASRQHNGTITASVSIAKRAEFVVAPKGQGGEVFFGR